VAGRRRFSCNLDVEEAVERLCADTDLRSSRTTPAAARSSWA
jgi:hypothetical protein